MQLFILFFLTTVQKPKQERSIRGDERQYLINKRYYLGVCAACARRRKVVAVLSSTA